MSIPRILIGMPTRGYAYAPSLLRAADLARRYGHDLMLELGRPIELVRTRMVTRFLDSGADYLVTIDDDVIAPEDAVDRLIALEAPVSTAPCPIAVDGQIRWNVKAAGSDEWMADPPAASFEVRQTGFGFVMLHRDVFGRIRTPWFQFGASAGGRVIGEDTWFSNGATRAGLRIVCDGSVRCSHFKDGLDLMKLVRSATR